MGQYGNQPDFATRATMVVPSGDSENVTNGNFLNSAALYIGKAGNLLVSVVGNAGTASPYNGAILFKNVPVGFFPVIVDYVWEDYGGGQLTTCDNIVALY
jgi:hypothetical protein